jgi:hypothetical protein
MSSSYKFARHPEQPRLPGGAFRTAAADPPHKLHLEFPVPARPQATIEFDQARPKLRIDSHAYFYLWRLPMLVTLPSRLFRSLTAACFAAALILPCTLPSVGFAADKTKAEKTQARRRPKSIPTPKYSRPRKDRPRAAYQRIRDEGLNHSHVMDFASALMDGIGPRLTGSPNLKKANEWTRDTLTKIGCENAHLEDWGEFGLGWQQLNTWARMVTPDTASSSCRPRPGRPRRPVR